MARWRMPPTREVKYALCGPVSGKCELKTLDAVAASRVACAGPMLSAGGRALLD